jgi:hypothetical protein
MSCAPDCNAEAVGLHRPATASRLEACAACHPRGTEAAASTHPEGRDASTRNGSPPSTCESARLPRSIASLVAIEMEDLRQRQTDTRGRWLWACAEAAQAGAEEPGNEPPISTRRAAPTGKPRHASQLALSRFPRGFPGKCGSSVFPLPCREGAEGVG